MFRRITTVANVILLFSRSVCAQERGSVTGRVLDQTGAALPGVAVQLDAVEGTTLTAISDADGTYRIDGLPIGRTVATFRLIAFATVTREITIEAGRSLRVDPVLPLSPTADITVVRPRTFHDLAELDGPASLLGAA